MKVRFIINPAAGRAGRPEKIADAVRKLLHGEEGIFEIRASSKGVGAAALAREAVAKGYEAVFACGGDGTVNEVASELVGTDTALGVVPLGSGNGFARAMSIPGKIDDAIALLKSWRVKEIDAGVVCGRYFFATSGCGIDAQLSKRYSECAISRRIRGVVPYYPLALWEYLRYRPAEVTIKSGGSAENITPFLVTAANTEYYGGKARIAPGADPADGLLDICIVPRPGLFKAVGLGVKLLTGNIEGFREFRRIRSKRIEITGAARSVVHADGEPFEWKGDIVMEISPKKLKVLA